jgi:hypothetical protein
MIACFTVLAIHKGEGSSPSTSMNHGQFSARKHDPTVHRVGSVSRFNGILVVSTQAAACCVLHFIENPVEVKGRRLLMWRELPERLNLLGCERLHGSDHEAVFYNPVPVTVGILSGR